MKKLLASSFLHFIIIGAAIFLLYGWLNHDANHPSGFDIQISESHQIQLAIAHERNFGVLPDQTTMDKLVAAEVKSEIYYREALRLGLDEDDEIIRRRLKQKYEFLKKDNAAIDNPSEEELKDFYIQRKDNYLSPAKYSFDHYYFDPDQRSNAGQDARYFISDPKLRSDPFHISSPRINRTLEDLRNEFGLAFAQGIDDMRVTGESFYLESGFGHHVVYLNTFHPSNPIPFESIRDILNEDYQTFVLSERNKADYAELIKEYTIDIETLD